MKTNTVNRRDLLGTGIAALAVDFNAQTSPQRPSPQSADAVRDFVIAGHADANIGKVKEMLAKDPNLVLASWDWGAGDWETALGGAGHIGSREMAHFLLENGARPDAFAAAMLGNRDMLAASLGMASSMATARGPHGFGLLYHAAISGKVELAEMLKPRLGDRPAHYNQALLAAASHGRAEFAAWLLANGVTDPNMQNFQGKRPLTIATEKGHVDIAEMLRKAGGRGAE